MNSMPQSTYIHLPFCKSKCKYCTFVSFNRLDLKEEYIKSLTREIDAKYRGEIQNTIYFGGGTPSLLSADEIKEILGKFSFSDKTEISLELNPDDAAYEYLKKLKQVGINRLSIGAQTFDDEILKYIGRRHNSNQILDAVKNAKEAGFDNISIDLIYGLPFQTLDSLMADIDMTLSLKIQHISTYGLKIEDGSYFAKHLPLNLPDNDIQADMYEKINEILSKNDFIRYEVSNFSLKKFESRHNLNYWNNEEYYGLGAAAHGYLGGVRYSNNENIENYIETPLFPFQKKELSEQEKLEEEIFLGFRKAEGIDIHKIKKFY